jgi:hypothetical protein
MSSRKSEQKKPRGAGDLVRAVHRLSLASNGIFHDYIEERDCLMILELASSYSSGVESRLYSDGHIRWEVWSGRLNVKFRILDGYLNDF